MYKSRETRKKEKYLMCQIPSDWTSLPVQTDLQSAPPPNSVAVYTNSGPNKTLVYEGYICPPDSEKMPVTDLQPPPWPPKEENFGKKYARLLEKIRAEEAAAKANSQPERVVKAVSSTTPGDTTVVSTQQINADAGATSERKNITYASKEQPERLNLPLQRMKSNSNYCLPVEILDSREDFIPEQVEGETEEFMFHFDP
ncbi:hypothetical protein PAMP_006645 [Pampus punctatissimus]